MAGIHRTQCRGALARGSTFLAAIVAIGASCDRAVAAEPAPLNVLFITVDDLRPQLGCYGHDEMVTPRLDRLAAQGRLFTHHYVQVPTCGASRCALLTGRYPCEARAYENDAFATLPRDEDDAVVSLPQLFRENGYHTASIGKITHAPDGARESDGEAELPLAWDEHTMPAGKWGSAWNAFFGYADGSTRIVQVTPATEHADVPDDGYPDGLIAEAAIAKLREVKGQPFFLAVGFFRPHLPFNAPQRYWDLYTDESVPAAASAEPPTGVDPQISLHQSSELTPRYAGLATPGVVAPNEAAHLRHAYAACVSYVDAQIGRVLDELDRLGLSDNTIVVVWGDHGWHLGEHGVWGKHTLHEVALRSPLIVRMPQMTAAGEPTSGLVESVDIYPTLAELCGLRSPAGVDGRSFAPQLADPAAAGKDAVFGFWAGGRAQTIRTAQHRLTEWTAGGDPSRVVQVELYDHRADPHETRNIAADHPDLVRELTGQRHEAVPLLNVQPTRR
jgi:arylsulfatase A-like enzyme